jgi:alkanesulfonate monooxygenase SsuD/methylene tetrahydromethanopterin reductase-like flavin-dependent oxidoreductase (luciferase family)
MQYAVDVPNFGAFGSARVLADLAKLAEDAGWDGFFIWDHIHWRPFPHVDPWVALAAMALNTQRIRIGPMITPIPRRRPHKLARETVSIDHLSNGRLILGVGSGAGAEEYENLGEADTAQQRGAQLDEGLEVLTALWSGEMVNHTGDHYRVVNTQFLPTPLQQPRIPIWVAGFWPNKKPMRRAARYDGVFPLTRNESGMASAGDIRAAIDYVAAERGDRTFDAVHVGRSSGDPAQDRALLEPYAEAGVTWWLEDGSPWAFGWSGQGEWPVAAIRERIRQGPPRG